MHMYIYMGSSPLLHGSMAHCMGRKRNQMLEWTGCKGWGGYFSLNDKARDGLGLVEYQNFMSRGLNARERPFVCHFDLT